jgi:FAD/FMN-containing dehydrogenase/Fe-S oxidoreductase
MRKSSAAADDRRDLRRRLEETVDGEVRFDVASRALYATDASNFRQPPIGVVVPRTLAAVVAAHRACAEFGAPIVARGCGTSLSGESVNVAVVIDFSKYLRGIGDPDVERRLVTVEAGAVNEKVNEHTGKWGLIFAPDPSTHAYCTIGGNVGNNSCGIHSVQSQFYGPGVRTSDNVESLEIVTYEGQTMTVGPTSDDELEGIIRGGGRRGEIYAGLRSLVERHADLIRERMPSPRELPRRVSGYNLDELLPENGFNVARALVGTEGTCANVLRATLKLTPAMLQRVLVVVSFEDISAAGDAVPWILEHRPIGLEAMDHQLFLDEQHKNIHPTALTELPCSDRGGAWLLVEFGADSLEEAGEHARRFAEDARAHGHAKEEISVVRDRAQEQALWEVREGGLGATAFQSHGDQWPGWEDSAVPPERVGPYLRDLQKLYAKFGLRGAFYGHLGQGCIHSRISFDLRTAQGLRIYRGFLEEAADLVVSYGGSLSGEHGDGQQRGELLPKMYGEELVDVFREFKRIWDPGWKLNPGKVVDARPFDANLKLGADYNPWRPATRFSYAQDDGDFAHATLRCVGVGKCRTPDGVDVMCPSYMATREEMHSTRGRTRLLFEMLQGEIVTDGWRSDEVLQSLDLCLACKGCTQDCPVDVDVPTYKAEFLSHYYARRLRPRHAYAFGLIDQASRLGSRMPSLVNALSGTEPMARLVKAAAGMAPERAVPSFAPLTLRDWFSDRGGTANPGGRPVVLWADTFNNYFHTDVGVAAVESLEDAGYAVRIPDRHVCCGRPLYDYGFLGLAERYLLNTLDALRSEIRAGIPLVGIEPSCVAVFRDELVKLLPHDDDARRLARNAFHFGEFLHRESYRPPRLERAALVWGHCHHKATGGMQEELELLGQMGVRTELVEAGCCGLAGSFGFEAGHYEISMSCGEQGLLPRVRGLDPRAFVIADGFSCKTQIEQAGTGRRALHLAELLQLARRYGPDGPAGERPERALGDGRPRPSGPRRRRRRARAALAVGGLAGVALLGGRQAAHPTKRGAPWSPSS